MTDTSDPIDRNHVAERLGLTRWDVPPRADRHALALVAASLLNAHHLTVDERQAGWIALQTLLKEAK